MSVEIIVPEMGESITEATIAAWHKQKGEAVESDDILLELETDKVTLEVPAPAAGVLEEIHKQAGDTVTVKEVIGIINPSGTATVTSGSSESAEEAAGEEAPTAPATPTKEEPAPAKTAPTPTGDSGPRPPMPAAAKLMKEKGLRPEDIGRGSGKDGQILKEDVLRYQQSPAPASGGAAPAAAGKRQQPGERETVVPMTRLRQAIAHHLVEAQDNAAILTTFNEVDMKPVMDVRKKYKEMFKDKKEIGLGFMSFFVKASVRALREFPAVNAEIRDKDIVYKNYYDIGVAVGGPRGLVVPVIRDADAISFAEVEREIVRLAGRVREGSITLPEMQGGSFTITNGGIYGSMLSTPIINYPQSGILGMHNIVERPVVVDGEIVIRPIMYVALSYDHRIIDGKEAVSFLVRLKECLEDPVRMLLEI